MDDNLYRAKVIKMVPYKPINLPKRWKLIHTHCFIDEISWAVFKDTKTSINIDSSIITLENGQQYIKISIYKNNRFPDWTEIRTAKNAFIGKDKEAFCVIPPDEYWNDFKCHTICLLSKWSEHHGT